MYRLLPRIHQEMRATHNRPIQWKVRLTVSLPLGSRCKQHTEGALRHERPRRVFDHERSYRNTRAGDARPRTRPRAACDRPPRARGARRARACAASSRGGMPYPTPYLWPTPGMYTVSVMRMSSCGAW